MPSRAKQILKQGDIIVSTVRPNLNAVAINDIESDNVVIGSTGYCVIRFKEEAEFRYVFNYCKSKSFVDSLVKEVKGASYPAVSNWDVKDSIIPLPPLNVQRHIADALDKTQEIIDCQKKQLEELDNLIKATFYDMFGDPVTNEKCWDLKKLGEVCNKITDGKHGDCEDEDNSGYYFISAKDIINGEIVYDNARQITKSDFIETDKRTSLIPGDVIVVNTGATIGKTALIKVNDKVRCTTFQKSVGCDNIDKGHMRSLLVMATGTGKTRTASSLTDVLSRGSYITNTLLL